MHGPTFHSEAQLFLNHCPSCAGQRPLLASPPTLVAVSHSGLGCERSSRWLQPHGLITSEAQHVLLSRVKCLPVQASPSFLWWVVALFLGLGGSVHVLAPSPLPVFCVTHTFRRAALCPRSGGPRSQCGLTRRSSPDPNQGTVPAALCMFAYTFSFKKAAVFS